jgi:hypothetical protein
VDDVVALLREAGAPARKRGRVVVVENGGSALEGRLELVFFLRTWALSHPELAFEVVDKA